jgi:E3 ubiquitin-protein ligase UBR2
LTDDIVKIIQNFGEHSLNFGFNKIKDGLNTPNIPLCVWLNCAHTIETIEKTSNYENKSLFSNLTEKQCTLLSNLTKQSVLFGLTQNSKTISAFSIKYLEDLFDSAENNTNLIRKNMFYLFVCLCSSVPYLKNKNELKLNNFLNSDTLGSMQSAFRTVLRLHCVQIIYTKLAFNSFIKAAEGDYDEIENEYDVVHKNDNLYSLFQCVIDIIKQETNENANIKEQLDKLLELNSPENVSRTVKIAILPFLKCSALFFIHLTDSIIPSSLVEGILI